MASHLGEVTGLLAELRKGNREVESRLMAFVYDELRRLASGYIRKERPDHTLQPTALVHEAYLRLVRSETGDWQNRAHFLAVAATVMRHILIEHARARQAVKRGEGQRVQLSDDLAAETDRQSADLLDLDRALERLGQLDPRLCRMVELRYFGGMTVEETAEVLGVSTKTVNRQWSIAKAWLKSEMGGRPHGGKRSMAEG
jgi:RNA polymerase sigma-70 factor (ECF subfamily)